jgi:adenosylmethionine-8-amino-7-oxononanoate aminotransferase
LLDERSAARRSAIEASHRRAAARFESMANVRNTRVLGTVFALDVNVAQRGYLSDVGLALRRFALERGVLLRPLGDTVYILPPYCVTDADLGRAYDVIAEFLAAQ